MNFNMMGVGLLVMTVWLELCTSFLQLQLL